MKKTVPIELKTRIENAFTMLENIENTVPHDMKATFSFKGRKSVSIASTVINELTDEDDIIFEPFMGGASFAIASVSAGRKIYATELDNYTYNAVKSLFNRCNYDTLTNMFEQIENNVKQQVMDLYETSCCSTKNYISKLLFDPQSQEYFHPTPNREIVDGKNVKLAFKCPICGKTSKQFETSDYDKMQALENIDTSDFPQTRYIENSRINITASTGADRYDRIFTKRNKIALLYIQKAISSLPDCREKELIQHALVASLSLARIAMYGSSTDILYHVVPQGAQEMNVWLLFKQKFDNFVKFKNNYDFMQVENVLSNEKFQIVNCDYKEFLDRSNTIFDMVYTDFPYTDQVPYLERNQIFRVWLEKYSDKEKYKLTNEMLANEVVQTNAQSRPQKKKIDNYYKDIDTFFFYLSKYVKVGGTAVFTLKLGKEKYFKTYIQIINLARKNGFEYFTRIGIEKNDPTLRKQSAYANTFINEIIVFFYKLDECDRYWYMETTNYEFELTKKVYSLLQKESIVTLTTAVRLIINDLKSRYKYISSESDIEKITKIIKENFIFDNGIVQISPNRLYLEIEDDSSLYIKLYDLIPIHIGNLLKEKGKFVLEDLFFELINSLCNGDPNTIIQLLENPKHQADITHLIENYCELQGKYWVAKVRSITIAESAIDISQLEGPEFEQLTKKLLLAEGYLNIDVRGGAGDLGVDITASKLENSMLKHYIFQCKRWVANVGSSPIQRLVAERLRLNVDYAVCVTTSDYTTDGKMIASAQDVKLINGVELSDLLNQHFPGEYFNGGLV